MGRGDRTYKSAKRSKELKRLKKQEEKRLRRLQKKSEDMPGEGEETVVEGTEAEVPSESTPESGEAVENRDGGDES